jgi:hypothetical protein
MRNTTAALIGSIVGILMLTSFSAQADVDTAKKFAKKYASIAKTINPEFIGFQPDRGRAFFTKKIPVGSKMISCSSCHTDNPAHEGSHMVTHKKIAPLSPVVNAKRFTDLDKIEKNFTEHCNDILGKDCTAQEKGDYIAYLLTVGFDKQGDEIKK